MNSGSQANPAPNFPEKPALAQQDNLFVWRGHSIMGRETLEQSAPVRRQNSEHGSRLINLERRARFCRFFT
jgi:hypothetical protein